MAFSIQTYNSISVQLDETNYPAWSYQMYHYLRGHGVLKFIDGSHPCPSQSTILDNSSLTSADSGVYDYWLQQDSLLISMITNTLSPEALTLVIGCQTSMEVWLTLKQRYGFVSEIHVMQLKATLQNFQKGSESIENYLLRFKSVRDRLTAAGVHVSDQDAKILILAGLPRDYSHTRQIIRANVDIGMEEIRSLLLSAEFELELKHRSISFSPIYTVLPDNTRYHFRSPSTPLMHSENFGLSSMPQVNAGSPGCVNFIGGIQYHGDYSQLNNDLVQQLGGVFQSDGNILGYVEDMNPKMQDVVDNVNEFSWKIASTIVDDGTVLNATSSYHDDLKSPEDMTCGKGCHLQKCFLEVKPVGKTEDVIKPGSCASAIKNHLYSVLTTSHMTTSTSAEPSLTSKPQNGVDRQERDISESYGGSMQQVSRFSQQDDSCNNYATQIDPSPALPFSVTIPDNKAFVSSIPDRTLLRCGHSFSSEKLCQALPLIPPG